MPARAPSFSVILAGGKGTRMGTSSLHKVCFPIDGVPAMNRAIAIYNACGIRHHIVVVGAMAGQVIETVGKEFDNVTFVYQREQRGTAHAARIGAGALAGLQTEGDLLVVAGDRIIEPVVLERLFDLYYKRNCALALLATPWREGSSQGRIVQAADGNLLDIVEAADIRQRQTLRELRGQLEAGRTFSGGELLAALKSGFSTRGREADEKKLAIAFGALWALAAAGPAETSREELLRLIPEKMTRFEFAQGGGAPLVLTPADAERSPLLNNSVYVLKASTLRQALGRLDRNNAQGEEYLTAMVSILAKQLDANGRPPRQEALRVADPNQVLGFSDPGELLKVEEHIQSARKEQVHGALPASGWYRPVAEWQKAFAAVAEHGGNGAESELRAGLVAVYGEDAEVLGERLGAYQAVLALAAGLLGAEAPVLIVRSPGRVNVMSRHIDHQGGNCNLITMGYETLMVVHAREDDVISLHHVDKGQFAPREFSIKQMVADLPWDDWLSLIKSEKLAGLLKTYGGDWSQYIMAAVLRIQKKFTRSTLRGMDMVVSGNVPMAAGLSSSSSLVVGTAEAVVAVNGLQTFPTQFVDLCGEGEWFVGTRGGSADHAAVKMGEKGKVIKVRFFDFAVEDVVPFPEDYLLAVCDSGIRAQKSTNAKDQFNHRISCYRIGFRLIKKAFPQYAPLLEHLRDVNMRNLRLPLSGIYKILLHLPTQATRQELREMLPGEDLEQFFATHQAPADGLYPIRGVVLYGLAECERARQYGELLKGHQIEEIGRLMKVSHDGDRVATFDADGKERPYEAPASNGHLLSLIEEVESGDPERVMRAQLQWQPGSYHCSVPAIDRMVDIAMRTEGVAGAQLAGAGLGGCMMVLARRDAIAGLIGNLTRGYYEPAGKKASVLVCRPIAGSGVLMREGPE